MLHRQAQPVPDAARDEVPLDPAVNERLMHAQQLRPQRLVIDVARDRRQIGQQVLLQRQKFRL